MKFFKSFSITLFSTILLTIFGIANNILITRQIGVVDRGKYSVLMNFIMIIALIFGEGIKRSNTILVGEDRNYLKNLFSKTALFSICFLIIFLLLINFTNTFNFFLQNIPHQLIIITIFSIGLYIFWQSTQGLFLGLQMIGIFNLLQVSTISFTLFINIIGVAFLNFDLTDIIISYLVATIFTTLIAIFNVNINIDSKLSFKKVQIIKFFNLGSRSTISGLFSFSMLRSGIFFSNFYLEPKITGLYSIALLLFEIFQKIPNTIGTLVISRVANDNSNSEILNIAKLTRIMFLLNFVLVIFLTIFGKISIILVFGNEFADSYNIILYMIPAFLLIGPASVLHAFFMGKGYPAKIIYLNAILAFLTIIILLLFTAKYGIILISLLTSFILLIWTITLIIFYRKDTNLNIKKLILPTIHDMKYISNELIKLFKKLK